MSEPPDTDDARSSPRTGARVRRRWRRAVSTTGWRLPSMAIPRSSPTKAAPKSQPDHTQQATRSAEETPRDLSWPTLEAYSLVALVGQGGAARVFDGRHRETGETVAIKVLHQLAAENPIAVQRLIREARNAGKLEHPGVVRVLEHGTSREGFPYLVMEKVEGETLHERLKRGPMTSPEAWGLVRRVAEIVHFGHERGVLHRDITPSNVMIDTNGQVRLTDFGLSRGPSDRPLTRAGEPVGTPAYMAPEQWWGGAVDCRADVYGLGAILYECLSGSPPWHGEDAGIILHQIATSASPPLQLLEVSVPPEVDGFLARCMARALAERPKTVAAFIEAGDRVFEPILDRAEYGLICAGLTVVLGGILLGYGGSHSPLAWTEMGGIVTYVLALLGFSAIPILFWQLPRAIIPSLLAALSLAGAWLGFGATMDAVANQPPPQRFMIFHIGLSESLANVYFGFLLAAGLTMGLVWGRGAFTAPPRRALYSVAVLGIIATLAWHDAALWMSLLVGAVVLRGTPARHARGLLATLGLVCLLAVLILVQHLSEIALLWNGSLTRLERVEALTEAGRATPVLLAVIIACFGVVLINGAIRDLRRVKPALLTAGILSGALVLIVAGGLTLRIQEERQSLWHILEARFSLWSALDPPRGAGRMDARIGPTLQLGRQQVALNGEVILPRRALETGGSTGPLLIAQRLAPRLLNNTREGPDLVLAIDRSLTWSMVAPVLRMARELGVQEADLLFEPGGRDLELRPDTPAEAALVLPSDLRALRVGLTDGNAEGSWTPPGDLTFGDIANQLSLAATPALGL